MAGKKTAPPLDPPTETVDATAVAVDVTPPPVAPPQVHTQERDPADRLAWKRDRAKQLGYIRD